MPAARLWGDPAPIRREGRNLAVTDTSLTFFVRLAATTAVRPRV